ncbi:hypothetical protein BD779DRAFT_1792632 [Infundibulicybe gibba]|nr:hypothetical protein BD779DRAFT_1792632 [Infundibulicybe gibba]
MTFALTSRLAPPYPQFLHALLTVKPPPSYASSRRNLLEPLPLGVVVVLVLQVLAQEEVVCAIAVVGYHGYYNTLRVGVDCPSTRGLGRAHEYWVRLHGWGGQLGDCVITERLAE